MESEITLAFSFVKPGALQHVDRVREMIAETPLVHISHEWCPPMTREVMERHYAHLREKDFFCELIDMFEGNRLFIMIDAHKSVVTSASEILRAKLGPTDPRLAQPHHIRFLAKDAKRVMDNVMHCSETTEAAREEMANILGPSCYDIFWQTAHDHYKRMSKG